MILSTFNTKITKQKELKIVSKKDGKSIEPVSKNGFRTKYLITSDWYKSLIIVIVLKLIRFTINYHE